MGRIPSSKSKHVAQVQDEEGPVGIKQIPRYHPLDVGPNWFLQDWIEGESELAKPIQVPGDVLDFRAQQDELSAALSAQKAARITAKEEIKQQKAEKQEHYKRVARAWASNSIDPTKCLDNVDWTSAAKAGTFFQRPIIDDQPSKRYIKNPMLSSFWDGLPEHRPPHHQPNVLGVWNNCAGQNDTGKALGEFGNVPSHRQVPKEKEYSEAVTKRIQEARKVHSEEAVRATCGIHKREDLLAKAHPASVLKGEKPPWKPGEGNRYFSYVPDMVEPLVCDNVMHQVLAPVRAYDHALQIVSGSAVSTSFWNPPKSKYHGTQRREAHAKELLKNHHAVLGVQQPDADKIKAVAGTSEKSQQARPSTAPTARRPRSGASSAGKSNASEAKASKVPQRSQSATVLETRRRSNSFMGLATEDGSKDVSAAPRPKSATPGFTKCPVTVNRPPSTGMRTAASIGAKPRPSSASPTTVAPSLRT